ncbi:low specificity L-threonine aldolase [Angustibacter speluncae]
MTSSRGSQDSQDGRVVDLRSDTVTRPTPGMRTAMAEAPVGDDVYGEDPTVAALEQRVAALLGHEAALWCPTGSLANVLGVRLLVEPGRELLCDSLAHVVRAELGAHAVTSGVTTRTWSATTPGRPVGLLDPDLPLSMVVPDGGPYLVSTAAVAVENTHNFGGGTVQPLEALQRLRTGLDGQGVALHLDGARLWNAHVADGVALDDYGRLFDTVSVCLSKGLGAPAGSVLVSSAEQVARARVWRKRMGGGMRQVGILAAAGLFALDHHVDRMADDHRRARALARACAQVVPGSVDPESTRTNIVVLDLAAAGVRAADVVATAAERDVLVSAMGTYVLRAVTHLDVDDDDVDRAGRVLAEALEQAVAGAPHGVRSA